MSAQAIPFREESQVASQARENRQLTVREIAVLQAVADGEDCKGTGELLGIAPGTVKQIRYKASLKLGAQNTTHAVAQALRRRIIS
jgi:DNA-binding NarL/FixJ family response regulator